MQKKNDSIGEAAVKFHKIQKCSGHLLVNVNNGMEKGTRHQLRRTFLQNLFLILKSTLTPLITFINAILIISHPNKNWRSCHYFWALFHESLFSRVFSQVLLNSKIKLQGFWRTSRSSMIISIMIQLILVNNHHTYLLQVHLLG